MEEQSSLVEKARKIWIDSHSVRKIPYFTNLHKGSISRHFAKLRKNRGTPNKIIDAVDLSEYMGLKVEQVIIFFD